MKSKGKHIIRAYLRWLDITACLLWLSVLYPFGLADRPTGRQVISAYAGKAAANGHRWGRILSKIIDWLACKVGDEPEHCKRAYEFYLPVDVEN